MANPSSRQSLIDYCLRRLGDPVIEINVDIDQLEDRVDEALQYWQEYHSDATYRTYVSHLVGASDVTNEYVTVSNDVIYVSKMNRLYLHGDFNDKDVQAGDYIVYEAYKTVDSSAHTKVWNDMWLKEYTTALIKQQWGSNLIKFEGMQLPGGVTLNGRQIFEDALQEIEKLREKIRMDFEMPADFFVG